MNTFKLLALSAALGLSSLTHAATSFTAAGLVHESSLTQQLSDLSTEFSTSQVALGGASAGALVDSAAGALQANLYAQSAQQGDGYSLYAYSALQESFSFNGVGATPVDIAWSFTLKGSALGTVDQPEGFSSLSYAAGVALFEQNGDPLQSADVGNNFSLWNSGYDSYDMPLDAVLSGVLQVSQGAQYSINLSLSALGTVYGNSTVALSPALLGLFTFDLPEGITLNPQGGVFLSQVGNGSEVPLPGAWILMASALGLVGVARRK